MRLFLFVQPDDAILEGWENIYRESLTLIDAFPAVLVDRFALPTSPHRERTDRWTISGDRTTGTGADPFALNRDPQHQFTASRRFRRIDPTRDILWVPPDDLEYLEGNGAILFSGTTNGYPYHLAILAAALLVESRLPEHAFLHGDIDATQVRHVTTWADRYLDAPLSPPICLDHDRLIGRLLEAFRSPGNALRRFRTLFLGTETDLQSTIGRAVGKELLEESVVAELQTHTSLDQLTPQRVLLAFLEVTGKIEPVIRVVERATPSERSRDAVTDLFRILVRAGITVPPEETGEESTAGARTPEDADDQPLAAAYLRGQRTLPRVTVHIAPEELLRRFSSHIADPAVLQEILAAESYRPSAHPGREKLPAVTAPVSPVASERYIRQQIRLHRH